MRVAATLTLLLVPIAARAADEADLAARLAKTTTATCRFTAMSSATWQGASAQAATKAATLTVAFTMINVDEGSARVAGQSGSVDVIVRLANGVLHFLESFREGPLYTTTVFPVAAGDTALLAVHSRHEFTRVQIPGYTSRPEQYYGSCEIDR